MVHQPRLGFLTSIMAGRRPRKEHLLPALVRANGCLAQTKFVCMKLNMSQGEVSAERYSMGTSATFLLDTYPRERDTGLGGARGRSMTAADDRKWES